MELHTEYVGSSKLASSFENINYYKAEDSGYHTSYTPGSLEHSDLSSDFLEQSLSPRTAYLDLTPDLNLRLQRRCAPLKPRNDISTDTPPPRRGIKRPHPSNESVKQTQVTTIPTPTTLIAGKIESLEVNEDKENTTICIPPQSPHTAKSNTRYIYRLKIPEQILPFPITPVKRNCKTSPCKSAKKLDFADFAIHSLSCRKHELQPIPEEFAKVQVLQPILARPNQKIDILSLLHHRCAAPALKNIFEYLNNEDSHNLCLVSDSWLQIWEKYTSKDKKNDVREYLKTAKENQENVTKQSAPQEKSTKHYGGYLKEIHNEITEPVNNALISPPHSPKTNRFRKFTKVSNNNYYCNLFIIYFCIFITNAIIVTYN